MTQSTTDVVPAALAATADIKLGSQVYAPVNASEGCFDWQLEMMRVVEEAGLMSFLAEGALTGDIEADAFQIFRQLLRSRMVPDLFSVLYVPEGQAWTPDVAAATAARVRQATGVDTAALRTAMTQLVLAFFLNGAPSKTISRASSAPKGGRASGGKRGRAARGGTASGTRSSGRSRGSTPTE